MYTLHITYYISHKGGNFSNKMIMKRYLVFCIYLFLNIHKHVLVHSQLSSGQRIVSTVTPCLESAQPQVSYPRAGPPPPSLIHMVELGFVGLLNNPKRIFAQLQKLEVKFART